MKRTSLHRVLSICTLAALIVVAGVVSALAATAGNVYPKKMIFVSGSTGGTYYFVATGMAKALGEKFKGLECTVESTSGAPVENTHFVARDDHSLGMATMDGIGAALAGLKEAGFRAPLSNLTIIMGGHIQTNYLVSLAKNNITTIADMKGAKIGTLTKGASIRAQTEALLAEVGLFADKGDVRLVPMSYTEQADAMKDNNLQVLNCGGGLPQAVVMDLANTNPVRLVDIPKDVMERMKSKYPNWRFGTIPGGTYRGQDADATVIQVQVLMFGQIALSEQFVYDLLKTLFDNNDIVATVHPEGKNWGYESTAQLYKDRPDLPWHPGTLKYLKERAGKS